ncbi:hypothetical protein PV04_01739 [Phialophora macrospora]|uniref:Zn(2)-C6 fungal-type domain-containing protein n=1 Tax=Phialophora macrospora TaxID=1851006 RepID=A0A0D2G4C3_9EURO|nr:hypothetical protein PV04_01739 [Phialophora macrospora]
MLGSGTAEKGKKKRAGIACTLCRARKVRCDAVLNGTPCANCRLDSLECTIPKNRRHRYVLYGGTTKLRVPKASRPRVATVSEEGKPSFPETISSQSSGQLQNGHHTDTTGSPVQLEGAAPSPAPLRSASTISEDAAIRPSLPAFIKALPDTLDATDLQYLQAKNAFSLPSREFHDVCVARYLEFAHPLLPLLDKRQLLSTLRNEEGNGEQISLLLFHAVMLSGVTFVEDEWIHSEGFSSRQAARRAFFDRAKALFNCNSDLDRLVACQAAVLLGTWHPGKNEKADSWFWSGTAVSLAYSIQLHLEPDESHFDAAERSLRRRLWWCAFSRDQKIALALGRPHRSTYYNVGMLTSEDLDERLQVSPGSYPTETRRYIVSLMENREMRDSLDRLCIEHMKLCVCIASFVSTIFKCRREMKCRGRGNRKEDLVLSPTSRLNRCAQDFAQWYRDLAPDLRYRTHVTTRSHRAHRGQTRCLTVHQSTIHVLYHVSISALYRLKALSPSSTWRDVSQGEPHGASQSILRHIAWELTRTNQDLCESGLVPYLSTGAVGGVVAAVVIHLLDVKAPNEAVRRAAAHGIEKCKQILLILKDAYGTAIDALEYLREAERQDADSSIVKEPETTAQIGDTATWPFPYAHTPPLPSPPPHRPPLSTTFGGPFLAASQTPGVLPALETSPFKEADEIFWQSWLEGTSNYDFLEGSSLPLYDLGFASNDVGNFEIPTAFAGP